MRMRDLLSRLRRSTAGAMAIETAIVAPVLAMMSVGTFEISRIVSRQTELETAVAEIGQIAIAATPDTELERTKLKGILMASAGLADNEVTITNVYRCGAATTTVAAASSCSSGDVITTYLNIALTDTYSPLWTAFGIGRPYGFSVSRRVIVT